MLGDLCPVLDASALEQPLPAQGGQMPGGAQIRVELTLVREHRPQELPDRGARCRRPVASRGACAPSALSRGPWRGWTPAGVEHGRGTVPGGELGDAAQWSGSSIVRCRRQRPPAGAGASRAKKLGMAKRVVAATSVVDGSTSVVAGAAVGRDAPAEASRDPQGRLRNSHNADASSPSMRTSLSRER
jgi:hypothetical protein